MRVFKFLNPYKKDGKTAFPNLQKKSGVYLIKENGKLSYIGYSANDLYKTMYRHFQSWAKTEYKGGKVIPAQYRVSYLHKMKRNKYTVRIVFCTAKQAQRLEKALILKHKPKDNANKYDKYTLDFYDLKMQSDYLNADVFEEAPF
jgi:excinuclease UvrABC nuclease subunit